MNKHILRLAGLLGVLAFNGAFAWTAYITNKTPFQASVTVKWMACSQDFLTLNPGERRGVDAKGCLMTEISADVMQTASAKIGGVLYKAEYTGGKDIASVGIVHASPYTSSGQRAYSEFSIIGPNADGSYQVVRTVQ